MNRNAIKRDLGTRHEHARIRPKPGRIDALACLNAPSLVDVAKP